jgi:hypothetical protein
MRLPAILRSRHSREADLIREKLRGFFRIDTSDLSDSAVHALAALDETGRTAGMTLAQRQHGLMASAEAMRVAEHKSNLNEGS